MKFCSYCGEKSNDDSKFCSSCGKAIIKEEKNNEREQEYVGKVYKCPNCGEVLNSFVANCPTCGYEINSSRVSDTLNSFIKEIVLYERNVAENHALTKSGWPTWNKSKKVWWVIFNMFFVCIPLVVYFSVSLLTINRAPKLSKEEKQLASMIENFPFPNERESILEALIFAKEKIRFIAIEKVSKKSAYWVRLWFLKASQLKQKADLMFPNDTIVISTFAEILTEKTRVKRILQIKTLAGLVILIATIMFFIITYSTNQDSYKSSDPYDYYYVFNNHL